MSPSRSPWIAALLTAVLSGPTAFADDPPAPDAVERLRDALRRPAADELERATALTQAADPLRSPGEMGRALLLDEWRDEDKKYPFAYTDLQVRENVLARFVVRLRQAMTDADPATRQAAATLIGDMAARARASGGAFDPAAILGRALVRERLSDFAPDLIKLTEDNDPEVCAAAARNLGKVQPEPRRAVKAIAALLNSVGHGLKVRAAAAEGLEELLATAAWDRKQPRRSGKDQADADEEWGEIVAVAVPVVVRGLDDSDLRVGTFCLQAAHVTADVLADCVPESPPAGAGRERIEIFHKQFDQERRLQKTLVDPLNKLFAAVDDRLREGSGSSEFRKAACEVLRAGAAARHRFLEVGWTRAASSDPNAEEEPLSALPHARFALVEALDDQTPAIRLAAVQALAELGPEARQADKWLASLLGKETDAGVRREAVRCLGLLANGSSSQVAVEALVKALEDTDNGVREGAAAALVPYAGEKNKEVVAGLAAAVTHNGGPRLAALHALAAIGPKARGATRETIVALEDSDSAVRAAAAVALGRFGTLNEATGAALRKTLDDPDSTVRLAAAEALLSAK